MTERIKAAEYVATKPKADKRRVRNTKRVEVDGINFDSKREAARYVALCKLQREGIIRDLELQFPITLMGRDGPLRTPKTKAAMIYKADFRYYDARLNVHVIEDAKGWPTDTYKMKKAILDAQGIEVKEV